MRKLIKLIIYGSGFFLLLLIGIFLCNLIVVKSTQGNVFTDVKKIPSNDVALLLGTNPKVGQRYINRFFTTRIDAAAQLYHQGKIKHILVSGDNSRKSYDESSAMRDALMEKGVPEKAISVDYAGFRTLDSVVRSKEIFGQQKLTIISQEFHNYRALFIAQKRGIDAVAFNADKPFPTVRTKSEYREYLARCKSILDLYILNKQPKFLGEKIPIKVSQN